MDMVEREGYLYNCKLSRYYLVKRRASWFTIDVELAGTFDYLIVEKPKIKVCVYQN